MLRVPDSRIHDLRGPRPDIRALGVGINLGPHAVKELSALGLEDALVAVACSPQDYAFFTRHGQLVYREPWGHAAGHQWPHLSIIAAICIRSCSTPCASGSARENFFTGHRCVGVEQDDDLRHGAFRRPGGAAVSRRSTAIFSWLRRHPFRGARAVLSGRGPFSFPRHRSLARRDAAAAVPHRPQHRPDRRAARNDHHLSDPRQYRRRRQPAHQLGRGDRARVAVPVDWSKPGRLEDFFIRPIRTGPSTG